MEGEEFFILYSPLTSMVEMSSGNPQQPLSADLRMGFLSKLGGTLIEPIHTFDRMLDEGASFLGALAAVALIFGILGGMAGMGIAKLAAAFFASTGPWLGGAVFPQAAVQLFFIFPIALGVLSFVCVLLFWLISSAISHFCARVVFGGEGSFAQVFTLQGYAATPFFLVAVGLALGWLNLFLLPYAAFLGLTAVFWTVLLLVIAVERSHRISFGRAFVSAFVAPLLVYLVLFTGLTWAAPLMWGGFWG
jgi:hypothetical protein